MDTTFRVFDIIPVLLSVGLFVIGLLIKNSISDAREQLVKNQTEVKEALTARYADTDKRLDVHIAEDTQKFSHIGETMTRVEGKLDQIAARR